MSRTSRLLLIALIGTTALIMAGLGSYAVWSRSHQGVVLGSVTVSGVSLAGLERSEAEAVLSEMESQQGEAVIEIVVNGEPSAVTASEFGYRLNVGELVDRAMRNEREGSFVNRWRRWLRSPWDDPIPLVLVPMATINQALVEDFVKGLDQQHGIRPVEGTLEFVNGRPVPSYPSPGWLLDSSEADVEIKAAALNGGGTVRLRTVLVEPDTDIEQITAAVETVEQWISAPVVFNDPDTGAELVFTAQEIADATIFSFDLNRSPSVQLNIDRRLVTRKVSAINDQLGTPPVNAYYEIDENDRVIIHPSETGIGVDVETVGDMLETLAAGRERQGVLTKVAGTQPHVTTQDIENLGIRHLVSQYTTYHDCCAPRVNNIQLFADRVNDALVPPGETFSLNRHVGERTEEGGFVEAGTLVRGELTDTVGGGVSQFATTFYNAVFWGGYEDITHKTHSFHFTRYPEGIEATINWPEVDLVFRNDSPSHVLIRTEYTDTSITVKFFGDNDGRMVIGRWRDGEGRLRILSEGGPQARVVSAMLSERTDEREPPEILYRANPELAPGEAEEIQTAKVGWTVKVTRTIRQGEETDNRIWTVRYIPRQEIVEMHPCLMAYLTDAGVLTTPEEDETGSSAGAGAVGSTAEGAELVCPEPEEEVSPELPEELTDRFPELLPEEEGQLPIDDEDGQGPIEEEEEQAPLDDSEQ
ncbi:MAG: VanW family protein [bacterium]|nr:VanW family protein [bacterium]